MLRPDVQLSGRGIKELKNTLGGVADSQSALKNPIEDRNARPLHFVLSLWRNNSAPLQRRHLRASGAKLFSHPPQHLEFANEFSVLAQSELRTVLDEINFSGCDRDA